MFAHKRFVGITMVALIVVLASFLGGYLAAPRAASANAPFATAYAKTFAFAGDPAFTCTPTELGGNACVVSSIPVPQQPASMSAMVQDPGTGLWLATNINNIGMGGEWALTWNNGNLELLFRTDSFCYGHFPGDSLCPAVTIQYSAIVV